MLEEVLRRVAELLPPWLLTSFTLDGAAYIEIVVLLSIITFIRVLIGK